MGRGPEVGRVGGLRKEVRLRSTVPLKVGVILPTRETVMAGGTDPEPLLQMAEQAEVAGFDSVWVGDSLFRSARFEPLALLSALAARTQRVSIGTAILLATLRHPLLLAHSIATIDQISRGRVILGVGAGWLEDEFKAVGVPFEQRVGRLAETIRCCRDLWSDGPTSFTGKYWRIEDVDLQPPPFRAEGPPIWVGGAGPGALRITGRLGDGWFPTAPTPQAFRDGWEAVVGRAQSEGRDVSDLTPAAYLNVNLDPKRGPEEMSEYAQSYYGLPFEVMSQVQGYFNGDSDACIEWLNEFIEAGVRYIVLRFATLDPIPHLERAATEILPGLRSR